MFYLVAWMMFSLAAALVIGAMINVSNRMQEDEETRALRRNVERVRRLGVLR